MYFHPRLLPLRLHAHRTGRGAVVVCLHSSGSSSSQWRDLASDLGHDRTAITPDLMGHGRSPAAAGTGGDVLLQDAAQVAALVAEHDAVHLVGHSYGAAVALRVALAQPARVRSLALFEPVVFGTLRAHAEDESLWQEITQTGRTIALRTRQQQVLAAGRIFVDYWSGAGRWRARGAERQWAIARRMPAIAAHFEGLFAWRELDGLRALAQPVLLLQGEHTRPVAARVVARLRALLPAAEHVVVPGAGHMGPVTHRSAINARILDFLRQATLDGRRLARAA
jgi:pimeloyl-ACP methyl ester carboxylesterase